MCKGYKILSAAMLSAALLLFECAGTSKPTSDDLLDGYLILFQYLPDYAAANIDTVYRLDTIELTFRPAGKGTAWSDSMIDVLPPDDYPFIGWVRYIDDSKVNYMNDSTAVCSLIVYFNIDGLFSYQVCGQSHDRRFMYQRGGMIYYVNEKRKAL